MSTSQSIAGVGSSLLVSYLATTTQPVFGMDPSIAVAGLVGSAICVLLQKSLQPRETIAVAVCGTAASIYLTSIVARWVGVAEPGSMQAIGLVLGLGGIYIFRRGLDILQDPQHVVAIIQSGKLLDLFKPLPRTETPPAPPSA